MKTDNTTEIILLMIVKNEEKQISRCLRSVKHFIDEWIIIDTGSTDKTIEIIEDELKNIPGKLINRPWINFGHNRTELLSEFYLSRTNKNTINSFGLLLDADLEVIEVNSDIKSTLSKCNSDCLLVPIVGGTLFYRMPYLVKLQKKFYYVGSTHEYLTSDQLLIRSNFDGLKLIHHADGGSRGDKFERDKKLLEADLENDYTNSRTHFYLAQTLADLGESEKSKFEYLLAYKYSKWNEERYVALLRAAVLTRRTNNDEDLIKLLIMAIETKPNRQEAYYYLTKFYNEKKMYSVALLFAKEGVKFLETQDILFIESWIYEWGLKMELGVALWWTGKKEQAKNYFLEILESELPKSVIETAKRNLDLC